MVAAREDSSRLQVVLRVRVKSVATAVFWLAVCVIGALAGIAWLIFSFGNPNYRFIFVPDLLLQVRNVIYMILMVLWAAISIELFLVSVGKLHVATFARAHDGVVTVKLRTGAISGWRKREWVMPPPVKARWTEDKTKKIIGNAHPRVLNVRSGKLHARVGTLWPWNEDDVAEVSSLLTLSAEPPARGT